MSRDYRADFGVFTPNKTTNESIYRCLELLPEQAALKIGKQIKHDAGQLDRRAPTHTYRELIVGAYLAEHGHQPVYERNVEGKTPDWSILTPAQTLSCILDVFTLYVGKHLYKRAIDSIDEKAGRYAKIAKKLSLPFVAVMYGDFFAGLFDDDLQELAKTRDISEERQTLSGVLFMEDKHYFLSGVPGLHTRYRFYYFPNASALFPFSLPAGDWYQEPGHRSRAAETTSSP